jgi:hypothetical protein
MKAWFVFSVVCSVVSLCSAGPIEAGFDQGPGSSQVDQYPGRNGSGWTGPWKLIKAPTITGDVECSHASPLAGGGNYLAFHMAAKGDAKYFNASVQRGYVAPATDHVITFKIRLDEVGREAKTSDFFGAFGNAMKSSNFVPASSWMVRVDVGGTGKWNAYDGLQDGGTFAPVQMREIGGRGKGLAAKKGQVYTITIANRPSEGRYDVEVTDGQRTVKSEGLGYRAAKENWAPVESGIALQSQLGNEANTVSFSFDSVRIAAGGK